MQVIATAGHAGHGKSTLVRALTGMDPHPAAPRRPTGVAADLGLAWMTLPSGERLAFVDVPGQEHLVPTMLAGVGSVPAVLFVVTADLGGTGCRPSTSRCSTPWGSAAACWPSPAPISPIRAPSWRRPAGGSRPPAWAGSRRSL